MVQLEENVAAPPPSRPTKEPKPAPGVEFAPPPTSGGYWPLRTAHPYGRTVAYQAADGSFVGNPGRAFKGGREGGGRYHVGIDLFAQRDDPVIACDGGVIVNFHGFLGNTKALLVEHDNGVVVNYGEVAPDSLARAGLKLKDRVAAGQVIGYVGLLPKGSSMLHFETYRKGTRSTKPWRPAKGPPPEVLNPTKYLLYLQEHGLGGASQPAPRAAHVSPRATNGSLASLPRQLADAVRHGLLSLQVALSMLAGERDENKLTNTIFSARHPERNPSQKIQSHEKQLAREWLDIRNQLVRPALATLRGTSRPAAPATPSSPPPARTAPTPAPTSTPKGLPKLGAGLTPPADPGAYRKFRLTTYHVVDQRDAPTGSVRVPIYDNEGRKLAEGSPKFFAQLALEGTGRLDDGRLINVTGKKTPVRHEDYAGVLDYHRRYLAKRPTGYSGIFVENERVVRALAFHEVPAERQGVGYGTQRGIPLVPFRTLAADIGVPGPNSKHEERFKGKGGLVPPRTHVYIKEYDGLRLPDGSSHDGWFIVNDTGGGIFGVHFDVFTGSDALRKQLRLPEFGQVWFPGIDERIPPGYEYGLKG